MLGSVMSDLSKTDLDACVALFVDVFNAPPWNESWRAEDAAQRLGDFLATPRAVGVRLATLDGGLLGFALGHVERSGPEDHSSSRRCACARRSSDGGMARNFWMRLPSGWATCGTGTC